MVGGGYWVWTSVITQPHLENWRWAEGRMGAMLVLLELPVPLVLWRLFLFSLRKCCVAVQLSRCLCYGRGPLPTGRTGSPGILMCVWVVVCSMQGTLPSYCQCHCFSQWTVTLNNGTGSSTPEFNWQWGPEAFISKHVNCEKVSYLPFWTIIKIMKCVKGFVVQHRSETGWVFLYQCLMDEWKVLVAACSNVCNGCLLQSSLSYYII